jgi:hypothetical protein
MDGIPGTIAGGAAADSALNTAAPPQAFESTSRGAISADPKPGTLGLIMLL